MSKRLTALSVENAKPGPLRREISDGGSGLYLIVQPSGHKSWAVRSRCLGHVIGGIRGTYDRHEFYAEKKHALEALAHQVKLITDPPKDNVSQLRRARP